MTSGFDLAIDLSADIASMMSLMFLPCIISVDGCMPGCIDKQTFWTHHSAPNRALVYYKSRFRLI